MHPFEHLRYVARSAGVSQKALFYEAAEALLGFGNDPAGLVTSCRRLLARQPDSAPLVWLAARALSSTNPIDEIRDCVEEMADDQTPKVLASELPEDVVASVLGWSELAAGGLRRRGDIQVLVVDVLGEASDMVRRLSDTRNGSGTRSASHAANTHSGIFEVPEAGLGAAVASCDLVLLESAAVGPHGCLAVAGSLAAASVAHTSGVPVWLLAGVGAILPEPMWASLLQRTTGATARGNTRASTTGVHKRASMIHVWEAEVEQVPLRLVDQLVTAAGMLHPTQVATAGSCPVVPELLVRSPAPQQITSSG
ncbi:MAG: hypothetical protein OXE04_03830 [bacterium]|nr:hypothetical protein [bacterium]